MQKLRIVRKFFYLLLIFQQRLSDTDKLNTFDSKIIKQNLFFLSQIFLISYIKFISLCNT